MQNRDVLKGTQLIMSKLKFVVVFVFATALAYIWMRGTLATFYPKGSFWPVRFLQAVSEGTSIGAFVLYPFQICWSCGVVVLFLSPPKSRLSTLCTQPGFSACLAVAFLTLLFIGCSLIRLIVRPLLGWPMIWNRPMAHEAFGVASQFSGYASQLVLVIWGLFLLTRTWRPASDPLEKLARILGALLILTWSLAWLGGLASSVDWDLEYRAQQEAIRIRTNAR